MLGPRTPARPAAARAGRGPAGGGQRQTLHRGSAASRAGPARRTHLPRGRGDPCHWGRGTLYAPAATDGNTNTSLRGPNPEGRPHSEPGPGRGPEPGVPARPPHPPRAGRPGRGLSPRSPALGALGRPGDAPPSGRAAETLTRSARPPLRPLRPRWAAHAAGEAPAPRPPPGRLNPAAPRAPAAASWPRASGRAAAGMLRAVGGGGRRAHVRPGSARSRRAAGQLYARPLLPERARPAAHSLTRRRRCASVRRRGERRRRGRARAASAGRTGPRGLPRWPSRALPASAIPGLPAPRGRGSPPRGDASGRRTQTSFSFESVGDSPSALGSRRPAGVATLT